MISKEREDDEINLLDLLAVLLSYKKLIIFTTAGAAVFSLIFSILSLIIPPETSFMPNLYKSQALIIIRDEASQGGDLSSKLAARGLGGMASMMGVNVESVPTYSRLAVFLSETNSFLDAVSYKFNLSERYKIKNKAKIKTDTRKILQKRLNALFDEKTGVFSISFEDIDPVFAKNVVLFCIEYYENKFMELGLDKDIIEKENLEKAIPACLAEIDNITDKIHNLETSSAKAGYGLAIPQIITQAERLKVELEAQKSIYAQLKSQQEMLKIKMASDMPVLQLLELPEVPEVKSKPSRAKLCIIVTVSALFLSIITAFALNTIKNIKTTSKPIRQN